MFSSIHDKGKSEKRKRFYQLLRDYGHLSQTYYYKYIEHELNEKCDGVIGTSPSKKGKEQSSLLS
jgi:hypothetical protein